jgi:hypothetical protein
MSRYSKKKMPATKSTKDWTKDDKSGKFITSILKRYHLTEPQLPVKIDSSEWDDLSRTDQLKYLHQYLDWQEASLSAELTGDKLSKTDAHIVEKVVESLQDEISVIESDNDYDQGSSIFLQSKNNPKYTESKMPSGSSPKISPNIPNMIPRSKINEYRMFWETRMSGETIYPEEAWFDSMRSKAHNDPRIPTYRYSDVLKEQYQEVLSTQTPSYIAYYEYSMIRLKSQHLREIGIPLSPVQKGQEFIDRHGNTWSVIAISSETGKIFLKGSYSNREFEGSYHELAREFMPTNFPKSLYEHTNYSYYSFPFTEQEAEDKAWAEISEKTRHSEMQDRRLKGDLSELPKKSTKSYATEKKLPESKKVFHPNDTVFFEDATDSNFDLPNSSEITRRIPANYRGPLDSEHSVIVYDGGRQMAIENNRIHDSPLNPSKASLEVQALLKETDEYIAQRKSSKPVGEEEAEEFVKVRTARPQKEELSESIKRPRQKWYVFSQDKDSEQHEFESKSKAQAHITLGETRYKEQRHPDGSKTYRDPQTGKTLYLVPEASASTWSLLYEEAKRASKKPSSSNEK